MSSFQGDEGFHSTAERNLTPYIPASSLLVDLHGLSAGSERLCHLQQFVM